MHSTSTYRTNRDLFSNHYLDDHLRETEPWTSVADNDVQTAYASIRERVADYNEAQLERNVIRPIFEILGIPFEIEETDRLIDEIVYALTEEEIEIVEDAVGE